MGASMKVKAWKVGDVKQPDFSSNFKVTKRWEGNITDVVKNHNKFYHAEIHVAPSGQARIMTMYGRVGKTATTEYRYYSSEAACVSDYESLVRKKRDRKRNPYREVDLAITDVGSQGAKEIKKPMTGLKIKGKLKQSVGGSSLHPEVIRMVSGWFGTTGQFITMTLKCPLGQLTKEQIDKGRAVLDDCKSRVNSKSKSGESEYDQLTSQFYSLIPHVLPHKIDPASLRLDTIDKIMEKHDTLDTFLDAKNVASVLGKGSAIDDQYKKLNAELDWVDPKSEVFKWIDRMVHGTRARNHSGLGKIKIHNVFSLRRNGEADLFLNRVDKISATRKNNKWNWPSQLKPYGLERPDVCELRELYEAGNVIPLFHGTRTENMVGITTRGLLIRPSGAVFHGAAFGSGSYFGMASKALGYSSCRGTYWAKGKNKTGFMFLVDVCLGDPKIVRSSGYYSAQNIKPYHSVWAKSGGYLINDEFITYYPSGLKQQHYLKYILEIETQVR